MHQITIEEAKQFKKVDQIMFNLLDFANLKGVLDRILKKHNLD